MLTPAQRQWKRRSLLLSVLYFVAGYFLCGWLTRDRPPISVPVFAWEHTIPFMPEAIWGYLLPYPVVLATYWVLDDFPRYRRFVWRYMAMLTMHLACFFLFPAFIERPVATPHDGISGIATAFYFAVDPPRNLIPSFHVSLPLLCTLCTWRFHRRWGIAFLLATIVVAASVLLVKQHYVVDVLASLLLAPCICTLGPLCRARNIRVRKSAQRDES